MNMNFADMNNVMASMVQQDNSRFGSRPKTGAQNKGSDFASRLDRETRKLETPEDVGTGQVKYSKQGGTLENNEVSETKSGSKFLSDLETSLLQLSGGDLNMVTIDSEGLDTLKKMLILAGFDTEQVSGMIAQLKEKAGTKGIDLKTVMNSLSSLDTDLEEDELSEDVMLDTSALPFIMTVLERFGLSKDVVGTIMDKADKGGEGISLTVVVEELKTMISGNGQTSSSLELKADSGTVQNLLSQLNMRVADDTGAQKMTLKDLLSTFDDYIKAEVKAREPSENASALTADTAKAASAGALVDKLFDSLTRHADKNNPPEFSFQQIKDQFKNELMIPDKGEKTKNSIFSQSPSNASASPDTLLKEIEAVLSKSGAGDAPPDGRSDLQRESKAKEGKITDISQGGATQGKNDVQGNLINSLKAKAPERALPSYVTQQVNKSIVRAVNQGDTTLRLQLKPASLGRLMLTIDNTGNAIRVSIITENHAAKEMLASNVNELKTALSSAGISLDSFEVDMSSDFKQSLADTGNSAGNFNGKNGRHGHRNSDGSDLEIEENLAGTSGGTAPMDGSYHFVA